MKKRIALISDHASPLAALGGTDRGGQNVYVANLALELAERGHFVDVFTRRESTRAPTVIRWAPRVRVVHVDAGPSHPIPKEALLPHMEAFATFIITFGERQHIRYDVCHANFWTSGVAARLVKHATDTPFVVTFHALGRVRVLHQGAADHFPWADRGSSDRRGRRGHRRMPARCGRPERALLGTATAHAGGTVWGRLSPVP